jgi:hypothetical protein
VFEKLDLKWDKLLLYRHHERLGRGDEDIIMKLRYGTLCHGSYIRSEPVFDNLMIKIFLTVRPASYSIIVIQCWRLLFR